MFKRITTQLSVLLIGTGCLAGCGNTSGVLNALGVIPKEVTLKLVNETQFEVKPSVYVSAVRIEDLGFTNLGENLVGIGINRQFLPNIQPGSTLDRRYDCDLFRAVMAKDAELITGIGFSPDDDTIVLFDGDDFECGDTVIIRYSGGLGSFDARISAAPFLSTALIGALSGR